MALVRIPCLLAFCSALTVSAKKVDGKVHDLTASNFDSKVKAYPLSFVEFYAPWCGHCKKLIPEWEKTAKLAKASGVYVAKVDAIAEKKLAEKHQVQSFPTLKLFRGSADVVKKYEGPRTADKMAEWLEVWKQGPILDSRIAGDELDAGAAMTWAAKAKTLAVLGLKCGNAQADAAMTDVLTAAGFVLNGQKPNTDIPVAVSLGNEKTIGEMGIPSSGSPTDDVPGVVILRNFDLEEKVVGYRPAGKEGWSKKTAYTDFMAWLETHRLPSLIPASEDTEKFFLSNIDIGKGLVILFGGDRDMKASVHKLAVKYTTNEKRLKWVHAPDNEFGVSLAKTVKMEKTDFPDAVIWEFGETENDDKVYRLSQQENGKDLSEAAVEELVNKWQAGDLSADKESTKKEGQSATKNSAKPEEDVLGVWAFDDAADPTMRGTLLSADMIGSRKGHTLVHVGGVGLLIMPDGATRVARQFSSAADVERYARDVQQAQGVQTGADALQPGALPCPANADMKACEAWCHGVSPATQATLAGQTCDKFGESKQPPQCMCYDAEFTDLYAMCRSSCIKEDPGTCPAGDKKCVANAMTTTTAPMMKPTILPAASTDAGSAPKTRYFLYDVKYGEGFNLQREVYPRAGWVVAQLNKAVEKKCGKKNTGPGCARWKLVLPPWCRVVHWWTGPEHMPWGTFFDMNVLMKSKVPTIEFKDYKEEVGGQKVDLVAWYATEQKDMKKGTQLSGAHGEFSGWSMKSDDCVTPNRPAPEHTTDKKTGDLKFVYAGQCEGGIRTKDFRCGAINGPWPQGVVDMLKSLDDSVASVLVKGYDYLLSPDGDDLDALGLRDSMFWSKELRTAGDDFIQSSFGGRPYVSAHCRRTDFLRVRTKTTPTADTIAEQLNDVLQQTGYDQVFIATDAPNDLREDLQKQVKGKVVFYDTASGGQSFDLPGKQAAVEMWVASRSDHFIGSIESRFTMWIQMERHFLGKPKETSEREFCKEGSKKCYAPKHRVPKIKGKSREAYQS